MPTSNEPGRPIISAEMSDQIAAVLLVMPVDVLDAICRLRNPAACLAPAPVEAPASVDFPERGAAGASSTPEPVTWLSVKQFVAHSGNEVSYSLVTRMARDGELEAFKVGKKKWLIHRDALRLYREKKAVPVSVPLAVAAEKRHSRERTALVDK